MLLVVLVLVLLVVDNVTVVLAGVDEVIEVLGLDTAVVTGMGVVGWLLIILSVK